MSPRWAFLGIGRVTPRMVDAVRATGSTIVTAAARNRESLQQWGATHGVAELTTDFRSVCERSDVDVVYVALPPHLHLEFAAYALECGKKVLCEKPLTLSSPEAQMLELKAKNSDESLLHATAFPHHPRSIAMREMIRNGAIGEVQRVTVACSFSHVLTRGPDYRTSAAMGGGCLLDLGWYCIYSTLWFTDTLPNAIRAFGKRRTVDSTGTQPDGDQAIWMSAQAIASLSNGAVAHWDCGFDATGRKWIEIAGTEGSIICDDFLRPWNTDKPRFWVHGAEGKAREVIAGAGENQECALVSFVNSVDRSESALQERAAQLRMGVQTQQLIERWEEKCESAEVDRKEGRNQIVWQVE